MSRYDIEEPAWWAEARKLCSWGLTITSIGRVLKKDRTTVRYVLDAEYRAHKLAMATARTVRTKPGKRDHDRDRIRKEARRRWRSDGRVRPLARYYEELRC